MTFSKNAPEITQTITLRHTGPAGTSTDIDLTDITEGTIRRRLNAAAELELRHSNPDGRYSGYFEVMDQLRVAVDVYETPWIFSGFIPPRGVNLSGSGRNRSIRVRAFDYLGYMGLDKLDLTNRGYDGWECASALGDIVRTTTVPTALFGNTVGIGHKGTNPQIFIDKEDDINAVYGSRKAAMDAIRELMVDTTDEDVPLAYHYFVDGDGGAASNLYKIRVIEEPILSSAYAIRTLAYNTNIIDSELVLRSDQVTRATAVSKSDSTIAATYNHTSLQTQFGLLTASFQADTKKTDELLDLARRLVKLKRFPRYTYRVKVHQGAHHALGDVVNVDDAKYNVSGKMMIREIEQHWGLDSAYTVLTLSTQEELLEEILA